MAGVWCDSHQKHSRSKYNIGPKLPHGYPNPGILCQVSGCPEPGKVWLDAEENVQYTSGIRIFNVGWFIRVALE